MNRATEALRRALAGEPPGFERVTLGRWPTPVEEIILPRPARRIWIKRDDLTSSRYGGNKVRKLEFLLRRGDGPVITAGALGSHHVLACAVHARRLGRGCVALLTRRPMTGHAIAVQALLDEHLDGAVRLDRPLELPSALGRLLVEHPGLTGRGDALWIPPGGSSPTGTLGYVACGLELAEQVATGQCPEPRVIYVALGTGGTAAGLALGLALAGLTTEVVAVRVAAVVAGNRWFLELLARRALALLSARGAAPRWPGLRLRIDHRFAGPGYGRETPATGRAVREAAAGGLHLETTYTGKALAALLEDLRDHGPGASPGPVMFLDTCGSLAGLGGAPGGAGCPPLEDRCTKTP